MFRYWVGTTSSEIRLLQSECNLPSKEPSLSFEEKHIDVQYHFVRDMVEEKKVLLEKVDTLKNVAYSLTKSMSIEKFSWCRVTMGISALDC